MTLEEAIKMSNYLNGMKWTNEANITMAIKDLQFLQRAYAMNKQIPFRERVHHKNRLYDLKQSIMRAYNNLQKQK